MFIKTKVKLVEYLSEERIEEYRTIYRQQFGREISKTEAYGQALQLIGYLKWLYRPLGKAEFDAMLALPERPKAAQTEVAPPDAYSKEHMHQLAIQEGGDSHD